MERPRFPWGCTLKRRLWKRLFLAFLAFGVTPMVVVFYVLQRQASASVEAGVIESLMAITNQKVWQIEAYLREREGDTRIVASRATVIDVLDAAAKGERLAAEDERAASRLLQSFIEAYDYADAMLVGRDGEILMRVARHATAGANRGTDDSRKVALELVSTIHTLAQSTWSDYFDTRAGQRRAWIGHPVMAEGRIVGYALLHIDFEPLFTRVTSESGSGRTEETLLVARRGGEVEFVTPPRLQSRRPPRLRLGHVRGVPAQVAASGGKGSGVSTDYRGVPVVAVYRHIPTLGWGIVVKVDRAEAFAPISRLRAAGAMIVLAALLLLLFLGWWLARTVSRPLVELQHAVERVAGGEFEHKVSVTTDDEVGRLSRAFNDMVDKLRQWSELTAAKQRLEAELAERHVVDDLRARLVRSEHLAALGRVATAMAHEFNNVLMSIQAFNDGTRRIGTFDQFSKTLPLVDRAVQRGKRITGEVRKLDRAATAALAPLEVRPWLEQLAVEIRSLLGARFELTVTASEDLGFVWADKEQLQQVFVNLALNARDAMQLGGVIAISAVRHESADTPHIEFTVRDSGHGIAPDVVERIFEPFFTTKPDGTGLGLAVAYAIVRAHGGQITVDSAPGGTTFRIVLRGAPPPENAGHSPTVTDSRPLSVLFVEDDAAVAGGVVLLLELEGFAVTHVTTAAAAMSALNTITPDVLLFDVHLPDLDGIALYREIEAVLRPFPVVFATGHGDVQELDEYATRPNVAFLSKPFAVTELCVALTRVTSAVPDVAAVT